MAKRKTSNDGYTKLLDLWVPPQNCGEPVGCIATTFTFNSVFFEDECLGRFVHLESDPVEDGPIYLIEREEKLSGLCCAAAFVDSHYCQGNRSIRWDLIPIRLSGGIMHAKIALLCWTSRIRLIITSANLTEDGYRKNQEIIGVLDYYQGSDAPLSALDSVSKFLIEILERGGVVDPRSPERLRVESLLHRVAEIGQRWSTQADTSSMQLVTGLPVLLGSGTSSIIGQLQAIWPSGIPPYRAEVISPFYDQEEEGRPDIPSRSLWKILRQRGEAEILYNVTASDSDDGTGLIVNAPCQAIELARPANRSSIKTSFARITENFDEDEEVAWGYRPLHAKALWFENDQYASLMIGSSNFTRAGLGLGKTGRNNLEANLYYLVSKRKRKEYKQLQKSVLRGERLKENEIRGSGSLFLDAEDAVPDTETLPLFFKRAVHDVNEVRQPIITLSFDPARYSKALDGWRILLDNEEEIYSEIKWNSSGKVEEVAIKAPEGPPLSGVFVVWNSVTSKVWWPIILKDAQSLLPPDELKDLPLELLISVLSSARPAHQIIGSWLKRKIKVDESTSSPVVDPHKRVDVSGFILQRTRKVAWALSALRERLERPVVTQEQLYWRLRGPIGVTALAKAIIDEGKSEEEKIFLTTELAFELARVNPCELPGCIPKKLIQDELKTIIASLRDEVYEADLGSRPVFERYVDSVFQEIAI